MQKVLDQYAKHITRIMQKAHKAGRPVSDKQQRGIAWYENAAIAVCALISQPTPAWYAFKFKPRSAFE